MRLEYGETSMKVKDWMAAKGVNQTETAKLFGTTQASVSRLLRGEFPSPAMMRRIAVATNGSVRPDDFFDGLPSAPIGFQPVTVRVVFNGTPMETTAQAA
jgi:transcriptional regulator with XRE-family HTH domain